MSRLRTVWVVASFDFLESLRSRKALGLLALALLGSISCGALFSKAIYEAEKELSRSLGVAHTAKVGAMADEVLASDEFQRVLADFTKDPDLAREMSHIPAIALFSGWMGLTFLPLLVMLTSADAVSLELSSGSARYALFRCSRVDWAIGKLAGQAMLMAVGIAVGAAGALLVAFAAWHQWHPLATALWMARLSVRVWIYGFAWLGVALGISLATRSVNLSRGIGLVALFALGFAARAISWY
ncbi:MAG: ABC transporter permease subunit, partial [Stellaceae bacterium]